MVMRDSPDYCVPPLHYTNTILERPFSIDGGEEMAVSGGAREAMDHVHQRCTSHRSGSSATGRSPPTTRSVGTITVKGGAKMFVTEWREKEKAMADA